MGLVRKKLKQIESAMVEYALTNLSEYKNREILELIKFSFWGIPKLTIDNIIFWLRKLSFKVAKKQAINRCVSEGYKIYVIRNSQFGFTLLSSAEANLNKKLRILDKKRGLSRA